MRVEHIGDATLMLGDCLAILPTLGKVDAVVADPPYGVGYRHGVDKGKLAGPTIRPNEKIEGDDTPFDPSPFLEYDKVILWGANNYTQRLPTGGGWLVWDKRDGMTSNDQADCEIAWTNTMHTIRIFHHLWNGMLKASERGERRVHQTQKPIALMLWCLGFVENAEVILDPYMGSAPIGIACASTGQKYIGIEKVPRDFDIACGRIEEAHKQPRLFADEPVRPEQQELGMDALP